MRSVYVLIVWINAISPSGNVLAQLPPKNVNFVSEKSRSLVAEIVDLRSGLAIDTNPKLVPTLLEQITRLIELTKQARQFEVNQVGKDAV